MRSNISRISAIVGLAIAGVFATASASLAYANDAGEQPGTGLTVIETITYFVGLPVAIWVIVWFLWSIPEWRKTARPATGDNWDPKPSSAVTPR